MKNKFTEADLAEIVIKELKEWHWEIYQEVVGKGGRCDIVAKQGNILWAIECKINFGFAVIEQAFNWTRYAHYSSIAVPYGRRGIWKNDFAVEICKQYGIGILTVSKRETIDDFLHPKLNRKIIEGFKLHEEQKTFLKAGSAGGGYWTDFKRTVRNLVILVEREPGIEFGKLIKSLNHHYSSLSSAKSCLKNYIKKKIITELELRYVDNKLCVFLAGRKLKRKTSRFS